MEHIRLWNEFFDNERKEYFKINAVLKYNYKQDVDLLTDDEWIELYAQYLYVRKMENAVVIK